MPQIFKLAETEQWPQHYFSSREKFIQIARTSGARTESMPCNASGPNGEALSVDIASFISDTDKHRIIISSGLHGAEGFIGAAIQLQVMQIIAEEGLPDSVGVVLIHAVNPWGYAHLRRVDENNVDVNRNFIDFDAFNFEELGQIDEPSHSYVPSHELRQIDEPGAYAALNPIINPPKPPSVSGEFRYWLNAGKLIVRNKGIGPLVGPIAQGQYHFPKGLFYGGDHRSETCHRLQGIVCEYTDNIPKVSVLDVHSGLGPSGMATLISNTNQCPEYKQIEWLRKHYQMPVVLDYSPLNPYNASGSWSQWCGRALEKKQFTFICVEIGTVNPIKLFNALRRENQAHHWATPNDSVYWKTKNDLARVFAPDSNRWREQAIEQGVSAFRKSLQPLVSPQE